MNQKAQELGNLCKQISLNLVQDNHQSVVHLMGDILPDDSLVLSADCPFDDDKNANLAVNFLEQSFQVSGVVEHCDKIGTGYLLIFKLQHHNHLQTRMLLQLSEIEQYRHYLLSQGRDVSIEDAAYEWVTRFAEDFAAEFDAEH
jgi:hypothetical protein